MSNRPVDYAGRQAYGRLQVKSNPEAAAIWRARFLEPDPVEIDWNADNCTPGWPTWRDECASFFGALYSSLWPLLTKREAKVIELRYLNNDLTVDELGQVLGCTKERARQVEKKAFRKAKDLIFSGVLGDVPRELTTPQNPVWIRWARLYGGRA